MEHRISVSGVLKYLGVSKSGYYDWLKREPSKQSLRKAEIMDKIQEIYDNSYQIYGAPKITKELKKLGYDIAERTVTRYMQELGIRACGSVKYSV